jgi:Zn-finger nucleic acid-binding protein
MEAVNAETLNCPMCGAPASTDAPQCEHCGARLATVACPSCFGLMFVGAKFCSHCGARADRTEVAADSHQLCPRCRVEMNAVVVGNTNLKECPKCEGIWADAASLEEICSDREKQAAVLGMASPVSSPDSGELEEKVRYVPCPLCGKLMNRVNFAHCSHVVVDVCAKHGTWFDKDELRRIVEFIRAGGLEEARAREISELEAKQRELRNARMASAWDTQTDPRAPSYEGAHLGLSAAASLLRMFLK